MEYGQMTINQIGSTANTTHQALRFQNNEWQARNDIYAKLSTQIRLANAATGTVAYTGVGFTPKAVFIFGGTVFGSSNSTVHFGMDDGSNGGSFASNDVQGADSWDGGGGGVIRYLNGGANNQIGTLSTFDSDGFTISWTLAGTNPADSIQFHALCFR